MHKKILSGLMALAMVTPAFADVTSAGGTGSVPVELNSEATSFSVTVPTGLPVDVAADGAITVSQENYIVNNSFGPVAVKGAKIETVSGWKLKDFTSRFETLKVNAKEFGFQLNGCNVETSGNVAVTNFKPIDGGAKQKFSYDSKVAPQAEKVETQQIASVVFTLGWDDASNFGEHPHAKGTVMSREKFKNMTQSLTGTITISTEKHDPSIHGSGTDVSAAQDGSVICVVKGQNATVYGDGGVKAPNASGGETGASAQDSTGLFSHMKARVVDVSGLDTSETTNMASMFEEGEIRELRGLDKLDTSKAEIMSEMFHQAKIQHIDLRGFDTSNVKAMNYMFSSFGSADMITLDLSTFDTSNVTHMYSMFYGTPIKTLDLSTFDTSKVSDIDNMFYGAKTTNVYCRTQNDLNKMKNSSSCSVPGSGFVLKDN